LAEIAGQRKETRDVESSAHHLTENLKHQLGMHEELLSLFEKKRRAVSEKDVVGLEAVLAREEGVVSAIRRIKESTSAILEKFAQRLDVSPDDGIINAIANTMEDNAREQFLRTLDELSASAREIASHDALRAHLVREPVSVRAETGSSSQPRRSVRRAGKTKHRTHTLSGQPA
jgi:hypothetical protein